jgi:hypothetical protein
MYPLAGLIALLLGATGCAQQPARQAAASETPASLLPAPAYVEDCQPCAIEISPAVGAFLFRFSFSPAGAGRVVHSIAVTPPGGRAASQTLQVKDMMPLLPGAKVFFGGQDLNFDGYKDLMIIISHGVANAYADYWLYDPNTRNFVSLGEYPVFTVDQAARRLKTYERGGSGGMIYESRQYAFLEGKLTVMRVEKQEAIEGSPNFRKTIEERKDGKLVTIERQTVRPPR